MRQGSEFDHTHISVVYDEGENVLIIDFPTMDEEDIVLHLPPTAALDLALDILTKLKVQSS